MCVICGMFQIVLGLDEEELFQCLTCSVTFTRGEEIRRYYSQAQAEGMQVENYIISNLT